MTGCEVIEQVIQKGLRECSISMVSNSIGVLAKDFKHILVFSKHEEETLKSLEGISEVTLRLSDELSFNPSCLQVLIFLN